MPNSILAQDVPGPETWAPHEWGHHLTCPLPVNVFVAMDSISNYLETTGVHRKGPSQCKLCRSFNHQPEAAEAKAEQASFRRHPNGCWTVWDRATEHAWGFQGLGMMVEKHLGNSSWGPCWIRSHGALAPWVTQPPSL